MSFSGIRAVLACTTLVLGLVGALDLTGGAAPGRFRTDDPLLTDNDRAIDASGVMPIEGSNGYDFVEHSFMKPGERTQKQAVNVNTLDEVPDSSWFTNRIGHAPMTLDQLVRGPNTLPSLNVDDWPIVAEKSSGITPGFRMVDPEGRLYQLKFDPPTNPEMASAAEVIGAAFYHAFGYHVVQGYLVELDPKRIVISPKARTVDMSGKNRPLTLDDVNRVLGQAARLKNGKYRALASRFADGSPAGYFKYYGTRPDDPNDIFPHEHRRELRGSRVFAAWLNHDDSRGLNSLDMIEGPAGHKYIKHYMFDFGSTLGSGSVFAQVPRAGNEYILEWAPAFKTLATLGLYVRPWITVDYPEVARSVGRFEGTFFDPLLWRPEYPNPAFDNMRADDAFWAARIVSKFSNETIRAVVAKGNFSEAEAADYITNVLVERRNKVLNAWLTGVNPLARPSMDAQGTLTFENAAVSAAVTTPPASYEITWSRFDNATGTLVGTAEQTTVQAPSAPGPARILDGATFVAAAVRSIHPGHPRWNAPVTFYFRRESNGWTAVGVDRTLP